MMNHDIFISYSSKQKSIADGVCHYLEENGFKCWMAPRDIPVGGEYGDLIEEAIKACKVVVLVFSEAASISKWVKGEINVAFTEDKPILPFRVDETEIKGGFRVMLNQMHWIDAYPHFADRLPDLLKSICGLIGKPARKVEGHGSAETKREKVKQPQISTNIYKGHEYIDLGLPSGTLWATCNIGAHEPEDYVGDGIAWGEITPKTEYDWNTYKYSKEKKRLLSNGGYLMTKYCNESKYGHEGFIDELTVLQTSDDAATINWGDGWRIPTKKQWEELISNTGNTWTKKNGVSGRLFTASNGASLFFPSAGYRYRSELLGIGNQGFYWSSSLDLDHSGNAWYFGFSSEYTGMFPAFRINGLFIRAVREN